ncbi:hypothetical protein HanIR_Chr10g0500981 [Helianthus annuus]|nr:hypothetical protein HanIR_Chr10g0500981 [Helianthus annuus]
MGFGVALGAWVSSRAWGGLAKLTWRALIGQTKEAIGLAVGQRLSKKNKKKIHFSTINLTISSIFLPHSSSILHLQNEKNASS